MKEQPVIKTEENDNTNDSKMVDQNRIQLDLTMKRPVVRTKPMPSSEPNSPRTHPKLTRLLERPTSAKMLPSGLKAGDYSILPSKGSFQNIGKCYTSHEITTALAVATPPRIRKTSLTNKQTISKKTNGLGVDIEFENDTKLKANKSASLYQPIKSKSPVWSRRRQLDENYRKRASTLDCPRLTAEDYDGITNEKSKSETLTSQCQDHVRRERTQRACSIDDISLLKDSSISSLVPKHTVMYDTSRSRSSSSNSLSPDSSPELIRTKKRPSSACSVPQRGSLGYARINTEIQNIHPAFTRVISNTDSGEMSIKGRPRASSARVYSKAGTQASQSKILANASTHAKSFQEWLEEKRNMEQAHLRAQKEAEELYAIEKELTEIEKKALGKSFIEWRYEKDVEASKKQEEKLRKESKQHLEKEKIQKHRQGEADKKFDEWLQKKFEKEMKEEQERLTKMREKYNNQKQTLSLTKNPQKVGIYRTRSSET